MKRRNFIKGILGGALAAAGLPMLADNRKAVFRSAYITTEEAADYYLSVRIDESTPPDLQILDGLPIPRNISFGDWLDRQPDSVRAEIFGGDRAETFETVISKNGKKIRELLA